MFANDHPGNSKKLKGMLNADSAPTSLLISLVRQGPQEGTMRERFETTIRKQRLILEGAV